MIKHLKTTAVALAIMATPVIASAQNNGGGSATDPTTATQGPAGPADANTSANANTPMGDTANPMATDTHINQGATTTTSTPNNMTNDAASSGSGMKKYPVCTRQVHDECRNRGGK